MDPDQDPTYPHPLHCHLVKPLGSHVHSSIMSMPLPPLFSIDPANAMQRTSIDRSTAGPAQPQPSNPASNDSEDASEHTQSGTHIADRVAMESAQRHDPQTQRRLDARDQDAMMAKLAQEQFELDRQQEQMQKQEEKKGQEEVKGPPAQMFIRDVSVSWGQAGSAEAQRNAAQAKAGEGVVQEWK